MEATSDDGIPQYQCGTDQVDLLAVDSVVVCPVCGLRSDSPGSGVLGDAFDIAPWPWGSREDPYVWLAVGARLAATPTPRRAEAVRSRVAGVFRELTGVDLDTPEDSVYLIDFDHGGFGGGVVDLRWWRERAVPLVVDRAVARRPPRRRRLMFFVPPTTAFRRRRYGHPRP